MKRIFYGWKMVGAATGLQFLQAGLMTQAFGGYVAVLSEERGWSKTSLSGAAALQQMEVALLGPVLGWLLNRFGNYRLGFTLLALLVGLGSIFFLAAKRPTRPLR